MASRPVYCPVLHGEFLVETVMIDFEYHNGFADVQKRKSISSLHNAFREEYKNINVLEVSSKSEDLLGVALSAFNLKIRDSKGNMEYSVECAFQSSKVFENGGPYKDILGKSSREAKRDNRLRTSGNLIGFEIYNQKWGLSPSTAFYDWLYINAIKQNLEFHSALSEYNAFTDIEFNPKKSINCQAYSIAMFCSLYKRGLLDQTRDPETFLDLYKKFKISNTLNINKKINFQEKLDI